MRSFSGVEGGVVEGANIDLSMVSVPDAMNQGIMMALTDYRCFYV